MRCQEPEVLAASFHYARHPERSHPGTCKQRVSTPDNDVYKFFHFSPLESQYVFSNITLKHPWMLQKPGELCWPGPHIPVLSIYPSFKNKFSKIRVLGVHAWMPLSIVKWQALIPRHLIVASDLWTQSLPLSTKIQLNRCVPNKIILRLSGLPENYFIALKPT